MVLNYIFLHMESRRYRYYELSRHRVHIMERFFYPAVLGTKVNPQWTSMLVESLQHPALPLSRRAALGWRLRRTYLALFAMIPDRLAEQARPSNGFRHGQPRSS